MALCTEEEGARRQESASLRQSTSSDVVMIDERNLPASATAMPTVSNMNVHKSKVHVGSKFVSITQNVHNTEVVKGQFLGLDLVHSKNGRRVQCGVAVFVCWTLVVTCGLSLYLIQVSFSTKQSRMDLELPCLQCTWNAIQGTSTAERITCGVACVALIICVVLVVHYTTKVEDDPKDDNVDVAPHEWKITRNMWLAKPYNNSEIVEEYGVLKLVIVQHTVSSECYMFKHCAAALRNIQSYYLEKYQYDIPYNFIVGNDGRVYEGRGWHKEGAHTQYFNRCSLGIGFIGDYREEITPHTTVSQKQLDRALQLLEEAVSLGYLEPNYLVVGAKDLKDDSKSPGSSLYNAIKKWDHYDHDHRYYGKHCDQIQGII